MCRWRIVILLDAPHKQRYKTARSPCHIRVIAVSFQILFIDLISIGVRARIHRFNNVFYTFTFPSCVLRQVDQHACPARARDRPSS